MKSVIFPAVLKTWMCLGTLITVSLCWGKFKNPGPSLIQFKRKLKRWDLSSSLEWFSSWHTKKYCFQAYWNYFHIQNQLKLRQVYYSCVFSQSRYVEFCESFRLSSSSHFQFFPCPSQCTSISFKSCIWNKTWWNPLNYLSFVCTLWYIQGIFRCIVFSIMSVKRSASLVAFKSFEPLNFPLMFALVSLSTSFIGHWRAPETVTLL